MPDMAIVDLLTRPATELAELIRTGEVTSRELVDASLARIEAVDDRVNAFTTLDAERARATADGIGPGDERPFAGVPIAVKDLFAAVAGIRQSQGSDFFGDYTPNYDGHQVRRLKDAGFVVVGVTASPELGIVPTTEPRRFGPTRNPWDLDRTTGGSSGGTAAAVAAGMVPLGHGSDGGGSIRIPAACCGLVGLKPARGRVSRGPELGDSFLGVDGVLTRTVSETAALLDLLAGYETGDATWAPPPPEPFAAAAAREPRPLRIALALDPPIDVPLDATCATAARDAAELLSSLGHQVDEVLPEPWRVPELMDVFSALWAPLVDTGLVFGQLLAGREVSFDDVEPLTWEMHERARALSATDYLVAQTQLQAVSRQLIHFFDRYDVLLSPALAERPVPIGEIDTCSSEPWRDAFTRAAAFTPYTAMFNVTGQPAISLPLYHGDDGLPTAVHLVGPPADEGVLLSLGAQLEAAHPWAHRLPPLD